MLRLSRPPTGRDNERNVFGWMGRKRRRGAAQKESGYRLDCPTAVRTGINFSLATVRAGLSSRKPWNEGCQASSPPLKLLRQSLRLEQPPSQLGQPVGCDPRI